MRRTRISMGLVMLAILSMLAALTSTATAGAQEGAEPTVDTESSDDVGPSYEDELAYWRISRESWGLRSDEAYVEGLAGQKVGQETIDRYSFPLTNQERQLMEKRDEATEEAIAVIARFGDHDRYGGLYLGTQLDDPVTVNIVGTGSDAAALKNEIRSIISNNDKLRFEEVEQSLKDLQAEADLILEAITTERGTASIGVDEKTNAVSVRMPSAGEVEQYQLSGERSDRSIEVQYEIAPEMELNACSSRNVCGSGSTDFRGGIQIDDTNDGVNNGCTSGFVIELDNGNTYLSTAGHCAPSTNSTATVDVGGEDSGPAGTYRYIGGSNTNVGGSTADTVLVGIANSEASNFVYRTNGDKAYPMTAQRVSGYPVDSRVCIAAKVSWYRCGEVTNSSRSATGGGIQVLDQVEWSWEEGPRNVNLGGASGGPLLDGNTALGTHKGTVSITTVSNRTTYIVVGSKAQNIENELRARGYVGADIRLWR